MLAGFVCPKTGKKVPIETCISKCIKRCHPLPTLLTLFDNSREVIPGLYHVTEILNPPQVVYLVRHKKYYRSPESLVYVTFGRAFHAIVEESQSKLKELGLENEYLFEKQNHFEVDIKTKHGKATLSGTPDLIIPSLKQIWDTKTGKYYYEVQNLLLGKFEDSKHPYQMNIYRAYKFPDATELFLEMNIKDFSSKIAVLGVKPIEVIQIPLMNIDSVKKMVTQKLDYLLNIEDHPDEVRECTEDERWRNNIRCKEYCDGAEFCVQFQAIKEEEENARKKSKRNTKRR